MPDYEPTAFSFRLRRLREESGKSLREVAHLAGLHYTYVSKVERGDNQPPANETILKLAEVLEADADELFVLAGRVPPDIAQVLSSDLNTLKKVRKALRL
jgi:transcriptional regulator with XRE-family HTH domain